MSAAAGPAKRLADTEGGRRGRRAEGRCASHVASAVPQLPQNFAPGAAVAPHWVQCAAFGASAVPQLAQNFDPGAFGAWQLAQLTVPAAAIPDAPDPPGPPAGPGWRAVPPPKVAPPPDGGIPTPATIPPSPI